MIRWMVVGRFTESCVVRWFKKAVKGDTVVGGFLKSKFGRVNIGTNFMVDGEGSVSRLLRSKS